jgi:phosphoglycolate phosphatase-like HAD superfamily hydrolase
MRTIKLIAIDIDGILLEDTFSPIMRSFVTKMGLTYTRELERHIFSRPQKEAAGYLSIILGQDSDTLIKGYFEERDKYIQIHGCNVNEGIPEFLDLLVNLDVRLIYYGGLTEEKFADNFKSCSHYFEKYICTNDFRPGIKEITKDIYGLEFNQVLFIDDVNTVAEVAKNYNVPFIGIPSDFPWGYQRDDMIATEVKYLLNSVKEIDADLLEKIDYEASIGTIWEPQLVMKAI